ncbi:MAG: tRNA 2-thiocytidine(32) synthetase TtcA [Clostridium sp.]|nr:tRNA 2-thiocytidine(32) synthetase TtcA [Clostridium sp.]MCM1398800.1 tRNA 2-thiocytidine(32) synthetase TtcA [Clostridium sp.]MCM1458568.1 tRNA 2-thiocytidine(32) synthetase TtcA [Bacteroides sp.]
MKLQKLLSYTRKAVDTYGMIEENDKIAVGISGGKDSLTLLYALANLRRFYPKHFDIIAITVNLGIPGFETEEIKKLCDRLGVEYYVLDTEIYEIIFHVRKESNPCSLCAKMRKGALNDKIVSLGCNKLAYAHHKDDIIETFMMSLIYEGRIHTFAPVTYLDRSGLTLIRPLMFCNEGEIKAFERQMELPVVKARCPADGFTKREYAKNLIKSLEAENPGCREKIFNAILNGNIKGWQ